MLQDGTDDPTPSVDTTTCFTPPWSTPDVWGLKVQGAGFRLQASVFRVQGAGFRAQGSGFRVRGSGFRVQGWGLGLGAYRRPPPHTRRCPPPRHWTRPRQRHTKSPRGKRSRRTCRTWRGNSRRQSVACLNLGLELRVSLSGFRFRVSGFGFQIYLPRSFLGKASRREPSGFWKRQLQKEPSKR